MDAGSRAVGTVTRYFVNCAAPTREEAHDETEEHGGVLAVRMHAGTARRLGVRARRN